MIVVVVFFRSLMSLYVRMNGLECHASKNNQLENNHKMNLFIRILVWK